METNEPQNLSPQSHSGLTKKERQEGHREERKNLEESRQKNIRLKKALKWTGGLIVAVGVVSLLIWLSIQPEKERLGQVYANQGQAHIIVGSPHPAYNSNPPTSGWHYAQPANWGIYQDELPDENLIHNLEHGGIWISYKDVDQETKANIEALAKRYPNKMIVTPRAKNDGKIVIASWTRLLTLDQFDEAVIVEFINVNKNKSPESNAQ